MAGPDGRWHPDGDQVTATTQGRRTRELLANLTLREVKGRYQSTTLGNLWSLINPIATMIIYTLVFGVFMKVEIEPSRTGLHVFALWLMCALIPWTFFANAITGGLGAVVANGNLVKKVYFPRDVLVVSTVLALVVTTVIELAVLLVVLLVVGQPILPWIPLALLLLALLTAFSLGLALMLSVANVYFRDTQHVATIALQVWLYATPIIYPFGYVAQAETVVNGWVERWGLSIPLVELWNLNPMYHFTNAFRAMLYEATWPATSDLLWAAGAAAVSLSLGYLVFKRFEPRLAEEL